VSRPIAPTTAASFLEGAEKYIAAACVLIDHGTTVEPIGLLASHGVELALKAFLLHSGVSAQELKRQYGHDLQGLWRAALSHGLRLGSEPWWLGILNYYYDAPYQFRYPRGGFATPIPGGNEFPTELRGLLEIVAAPLGLRLMNY
jgi:hypothetical protein